MCDCDTADEVSDEVKTFEIGTMKKPKTVTAGEDMELFGLNFKWHDGFPHGVDRRRPCWSTEFVCTIDEQLLEFFTKPENGTFEIYLYPPMQADEKWIIAGRGNHPHLDEFTKEFTNPPPMWRLGNTLWDLQDTLELEMQMRPEAYETLARR